MVSLSCSYVADLPALSDTQLEKLYGWIKKSCKAGDVHLNQDGSMQLFCTRSGKAVDKRQHQRTLRTNLMNWGVDLATRQTDWLRLIDEEAVSGETEEAERNALESASEDVEIMAEVTSMTEPRIETNKTSDITPVTKHAIMRCSAEFELPLPPNLLRDPAFFSMAVH